MKPTTYLSRLLLVLFLSNSTPKHLLAATNAGIPPPGGEKRKVNIDRSNYTLPNGMQYSQVLNMQPSIANESDLTFQSAITMGLTGNTQIGQMAVDADGNRYVTGGFSGTIQYGEIVVESSGGYDLFVAKLNPQGQVIWYQLAHGSEEVAPEFSLEGALTLALDNDGNVYIGGSFVKELRFVDNEGNTIETLQNGRDDALLNLELFAAKYDTDGNFLWSIGGESGSPAISNSLSVGINSVNTIMIDSEGYPYFAGGFSGSNLFGEDVTVNGDSDFFIASLSKEGDEIFWVDVFGTPSRDYAASISVDTLGYLNILGIVGEGIMDLPDADISWNNDSGAEDTFFISYDVNGEWYFASFLGAGERVVGNSIASTQDGSIYVGGFFSGTATFEGSDESIEAMGNEDGFLAKYDLNGDIIWARNFGFDFSRVDVVTLDHNEDVLILGRYTDSIVFNSDSDSPTMLTTESPQNMFMAKFDAAGNFVWAKNIEGSGSEAQEVIFEEETRPFAVNPLDIITSTYNGGEIILAGDFDGTLTLDGITLNANNERLLFMGVMPTSGAVSAEQDQLIVPSEIQLSQNFPNPFNPTTNISFSLPEASNVTISIFSVTGQLVATLSDDFFAAGKHSVMWDASGLASGTYVYKMNTANFSLSKKMTLLK